MESKSAPEVHMVLSVFKKLLIGILCQLITQDIFHMNSYCFHLVKVQEALGVNLTGKPINKHGFIL